MSTTEFVNHEQESLTPAETLQLQHAAMRVQFTWMGTKKALTDSQRSEVASDFNANSKMLSASKKLFDPRHPAYRAVSAVKRLITDYWKQRTLPFPEPGIRLLPQDKLIEFDEFMVRAQKRLRHAVDELQEHYADIRMKARNDLGDLFDENDYPSDLTGLFGVHWNVENVAPPDYLLELKPHLYEREMQRVRGIFNNAVELAEQAFASELVNLVSNLTDRLSDNEDGTPKVFGDGCVDKLKAFIARFRDLSVKSNDELEHLVNECDNLTRGVSAESFRNLPVLRQYVSQKLTEVQDIMERDLAVSPRRKIVRRKKDTQ